MKLEDDNEIHFFFLERRKMKRVEKERKDENLEDQSRRFHIHLGGILSMRLNGKEEIIKKLYKDTAQKQMTWFSSCKWLIASSVQQMKQNEKWIATVQVRSVLLKYLQITENLVKMKILTH